MADDNLNYYLVRADGQTLRIRADSYSHAGSTLRFHVNGEGGAEPKLVAAIKDPNWFGLYDSVDVITKEH